MEALHSPERSRALRDHDLPIALLVRDATVRGRPDVDELVTRATPSTRRPYFTG